MVLGGSNISLSLGHDPTETIETNAWLVADYLSKNHSKIGGSIADPQICGPGILRLGTRSNGVLWSPERPVPSNCASARLEAEG
jgi:hypothetical protein